VKSQSYNFEIKDLLTQFLCAFDDVVIKRYDKDRNALENIEVRYVLAPKQRVMYDIVNKAQNLTLPVVAVNVTGISRDTTRVFNKLDSVYNPRGEANNSTIMMPVPINIEVSMSILARYMQDMDQILSNFIPYNNPYIILSWKEPATTAFDPVEIRSEVLWGGSISLTEPTDTTYSDKFRIIADTSFTIKGWLFKNQNEISKQIYFIDNNFRTAGKNLILTDDNYNSIVTSLCNYTETETISISAIPTITNIFYNISGNLNEIRNNFSLNQQITSNNNFMFYGTNYDKVTTILLSSNNTITGTVSTINPPYTDTVTGTVLDPIYYNIVNDNIITINLPYLQDPGNFNFIICNPVGCTNSNLVNNFTFTIPDITQICVDINDSRINQGGGSRFITFFGSLTAGGFYRNIIEPTGDPFCVVILNASIIWNNVDNEWVFTYASSPSISSTGSSNRYNPIGASFQVNEGNYSVSADVIGYGYCAGPDSDTCVFEWNTDTYYGTLSGNPWSTSINGSRIRFNVEDSINCGGNNNLTQGGTATSTITTGASAISLVVNISGIAEEQAPMFENLTLYLNNNIMATGISPGTIGGGTCDMGSAVITYNIAPPYILPPFSVNTIRLEMDTVDSQYHVGAYYQADFACATLSSVPIEQTQLCITLTHLSTEQITLLGSLSAGNFTGYTSEFGYEVGIDWRNISAGVWEWVMTYDTGVTILSSTSSTGATSRYNPISAAFQIDDGVVSVSSIVNSFSSCSAVSLSADQTILCANILTYDGINSTDRYYTLSGSLSAGYFSCQVTGIGPLSDGTVVLEWSGTEWVGTNTASPTDYTSGDTSNRDDPSNIIFAKTASGGPEPWYVVIGGFGLCCGDEQTSVVVNLDYWDGADQNVDLTLTGSLFEGSFTDGTYTLEWDLYGPANGWTITANNGVIVDNWLDNTSHCLPISAVISQSDTGGPPPTIFTVLGWGS
jgi:hypothetical protein